MTIYDIIIVMKNNILTILCCTAVLLVLSACIDPVGLEDFLNDERVQEIIADRDPYNQVTLDNAPDFEPEIDGRLRPGNTRINGLRPDRYYLVEETGPGISPPVISFVQPDGNLSSDLEDIGFVPGGRILGLDNLNTYTVRAARPFVPTGGSVSFFTALTAGLLAGTEVVTDGAVSLPGDAAGLYLDPDLIGSFNVVKIPISPSGDKIFVSLTPGDRIPLAGENTITDYVFSDPGNFMNFYVLRVVIEPATTVVVTTVEWTTPAAPMTFTPNTFTFTQAEALAATNFSLTISNAEHFTGGFELISPFDGTVLDTATVAAPTLSFVLNTVSGLEVLGSYEFTIVGTRTETGGVYTGVITITIN